jgi:hypothetical protein
LPVSLRLVAVLSCWLPAAADAAETAPLAFPIAEAPLAAQLAGIDPQWNISLKAAGKVRVLRAEELAYWGGYRDAEAGPQVLLTDGSVIRSDLLVLDDGHAVLGDATGLGRGQWDESKLPRAAVAAILWQPPADSGQRDRLLLSLLGEAASEDRLILLGGESLAGTLIAAPRSGRFAAEDVKPGEESFELLRRGRGEPLKIPAARVVAIRLAGPAAESRPVGTMTVWLGLADGSLVRARQIAVHGDAVTLTMAAGGELVTTLTGRRDPSKKFWDEVTYLEPASSRATWLSDAAALDYRHIPFVSTLHALGQDTSVLGTRLRAGGQVFRKGLGMPTAARVAAGCSGYRRFEAQIALDDAAGLAGSVIFKVLIESSPGQWQTAYESPPLRGGDAPRPVSIDLAGAARLVLLTDFSDRGDSLDYADWLLARLVK